MENKIETNVEAFMPFFKNLTVQDFESITYAMIKPDSISAKEDMLRDIQGAGFEIIFKNDKYQFSDQLVANFYSEHGPRGDQPAKPFYPGLCRQMTAGPVVVMILRKRKKTEDEPLCYAQWRKVMGSTNPANAKGTLRYKYTQILFGGPEKYANGEATNCFHGSDSLQSVIREANLVLYDMMLHN